MQKFYLFFFISSILISLSYIVLILFYYNGWKKLNFHSFSDQIFKTHVSIIVPARNEEASIENCIKAILNQRFPRELFEVIIVDDHSTDRTFEIATSFASDQLRVLKLTMGHKCMAFKKTALHEAIKISNGELIITTDADCYMNEKWLCSIVSLYEQEKPKMIVGPVCFDNEKSFFEKIQSVEFMSLVGSSGASLFFNKPLMCNGANLAYEKKSFEDMGGFQSHEGVASGDDMLLMLNLKKTYPKGIRFLKAYDAIVFTQAQKTLSSFWEQRKRWVSKSKYYTDYYVIAISLLIYLSNLLPLASIFLSIIYYKFIIIFLFAFAIKALADYLFLREISRFFKKEGLMNLFLSVELLYLVYVTFIGIIGNMKTYNWKERKYKSIDFS
jgi:cellulose synthase/poly-beta-1,6-N-acetylglucosamine synthase-like glycosyltransferase